MNYTLNCFHTQSKLASFHFIKYKYIMKRAIVITKLYVFHNSTRKL